MQATQNSIIHAARTLRTATIGLIIGFCIPDARAGDWSLVREVSLEGERAEVCPADKCLRTAEGWLLIAANHEGVLPQPEPNGIKYFETNDLIAGDLLGTFPDRPTGLLTIRYTLVYIGADESDVPPERIVVAGAAKALVAVGGEPSANDCCPPEDALGVANEAVADAFGALHLTSAASLTTDCEYSQHHPDAEAVVAFLRTISMQRPDPVGEPLRWAASFEIECRIELSGTKEAGQGPPYLYLTSEASVEAYPAEPGFLFPAFSLPSGPGGGCECGILTIEPLSGTATAGGEFVVFTDTVPLRSQRQDDGREGGDPGPIPTLYPPPFGNMSHWLSMRVEPGQALLDYLTPNTFSNDVDPAGRLGFVVVPSRTTETAVGSPSASARAGVLASTTQGLTSLTDPDSGDFAVDATGTRIRFGSYNGAEWVESNLSFVTGGSTITNAGPPGRIASKGGWTYTFGLYTELTDNVPIHLLTGITDPFGNEVSINHEQRIATFSWAGRLGLGTCTRTSQAGRQGPCGCSNGQVKGDPHLRRAAERAIRHRVLLQPRRHRAEDQVWAGGRRHRLEGGEPVHPGRRRAADQARAPVPCLASRRTDAAGVRHPEHLGVDL